MKFRRLLSMMTALLLALTNISAALGREAAGALTLSELEAWLRALKADYAEQQPLNAPVGEESKTEDGYAFLYEAATLYYTAPSTGSELLAVTLTDAAQPGPRGVSVGDDQSRLMAAYGWQNPDLMGDGTVAALYMESDLPAEARWSWAIHADGELLSVQCAIHSALGGGMYTDMGIIYQLDQGQVERIRVYGLSGEGISEADVLANLGAVSQSMAQLSGDDQAAAGRWQRSEAPAFGAEDLVFGGLSFLTMTDDDATALYGLPLTTDVLPDADGLLYLTTEREGLSIGYLQSHDETMVQVQSIAITTSAIEGPRGLRVGMPLEEAVLLMRCDGDGRVLGSANLLYGDGQSAPYGLEEADGMGGAVLRYLTEVQTDGGLLTVTLHLTFQQDLLTEIYLYAW